MSAAVNTGLAIVFAGPVCRLDFTPDVAAHFTRLLAAEEESTTRVGSTLEEKKASGAPPLREQRFLQRDRDRCLNGIAP